MCGADERSIDINDAVDTSKYRSRRRLPKGVYGDNMIAQKSDLDVRINQNEGSYS